LTDNNGHQSGKSSEEIVRDASIAEMARNLELQVEMGDGSWWTVPASVVATDRAERISTTDDIERFVRVFSDTLCSEEILIQWAEEMMTWEGVKPLARLFKDESVPNPSLYDSDWKSGMKQLVKKK
jgi:hypothetical protein